MNPAHVALALISHTNNGKTTLARTLVGIDVGEVRDAAHVTTMAEAHPLLRTPEGDSLELWDTPGFGDSVRLLRRLALAGNPIGWFLREVIDRYRDRPFWLSQQALRTARDAADVVLYLVNSSEHPRDAGYLPAEMKILEWLGKPVLVLLNQLGPPRPAQEERDEQQRWQRHLEQFPIVRGVLALDAFARCWVHERVFYDAVGAVLDPAKQPGYARLFAVWERYNIERFHAAMDLIGAQLAAAACDAEPIPEAEEGGVLQSAMKVIGLGKGTQKRRQEQAMAQLLERVNASIGATTAGLLKLHQLDPGETGRIHARVREHFAVRAPVDKTQASLLGAIVSGAATGLSADLMAGGLTFGGGALIGGIVGALTMAGAAWGFNTTTRRDRPSVQFADDFLHSLLVSNVLRYLAVAHFGRGRGNFVESEAPPFWQEELEDALGRHPTGAVWQEVREGDGAGLPLARLAGAITRDVLDHLYPGSLPLSRLDM